MRGSLCHVIFLILGQRSLVCFNWKSLCIEKVDVQMSTSWIVQGLRAIVADLTDECSGSGITVEVAEGYRWRIEIMYRDLLAKELVNGLCPQETGALVYLAKAHPK